MSTLTRWVLLGGCLGGGLIGCKDLAGTPPLPAGTSSPGIVQNAAGALQTAVAAQAIFQQAFADYIPISGELTDELQSQERNYATNATGPDVNYYNDIEVDARLLDQTTDWTVIQFQGNVPTDSVYGRLQLVRALASQAIGGLKTYAADSTILQGEIYALSGYAEIMLADLYCSGVPLSTLNFQGDYTYQPGSTTAQIYRHAIAMFDTALTLAGTNSQIANLAKVGQGRAYLAIGEYTNAGQAVSTVPGTFQFVDSVGTCNSSNYDCIGEGNGVPLATATFSLQASSAGVSVSDREAGVGLPYVSSDDPRTADTLLANSDPSALPQYYPKKYSTEGVNALLLASGLEAQLIAAEVDLNTNNAVGAFTILNALRKSNATTMNLPILTDPGTLGAELDTLFTERAAWLFVDGHRQGDLRRLVRNYVNGQSIHVVANQYPSGDYGFGVGLYGEFIDAPVPAGELNNPYFTGCLSRD